MYLTHIRGIAGDQGVEVEEAIMVREGGLQRSVWRGRATFKASWVGLEEDEEEENGVRRKGRGKEGLLTRRVEMGVEGVIVEEKGLWIGLEEENKEKWVRRKGRRGKEGLLARNGWNGHGGGGLMDGLRGGGEGGEEEGEGGGWVARKGGDGGSHRGWGELMDELGGEVGEEEGIVVEREGSWMGLEEDKGVRRKERGEDGLLARKGGDGGSHRGWRELMDRLRGGEQGEEEGWKWEGRFIGELSWRGLWANLEEDDQEKGVRKRGRGRMGFWRGAEVEGDAMEGEGLWAGLEVEDEEEWEERE